jgi:hypothetical protein
VTTIALLNLVLAVVAVAVLVAVKLAAYHVAGKEPVEVMYVEDERLAA